MRPENRLSRRSVLRTAGSALVGVGATGLSAATSRDVVEVNVGYATADGRTAALNAADEVVREFEFDALTMRAEKRAVTELRDNPGIRYVEENGTVHALGQTLPWGIDRIDAEVAHECGYTGEGAHVAIIDTGIDDDHPELQPHLGKGKAFVNCQGTNCNYAWSDDDDHGTHCAGIAGAVDNTEGVVGVAPDATLHSVKVLDENGSGTYSDVAAGIEYTADQGWDVGNLSLGADSGSQTLHDACRYAYDLGVLLVAAAGNDGPCSGCVDYPAAYDEVIAVTSIDQNDNFSSFSSTGQEVELTAPGEDVYSTVIGGYATWSGTSMAAPHVSGTGALLMGYKIDLSNFDARNRLCNTAESIGLASNQSGCGLVDAAAAVDCGTDDN